MATPEALRARLATFENPTGREEAEARVRALPEDLAGIGMAFLDRKRSDRREAIEELPPERLRMLFEALLPGLGSAMEASWRLQHVLPYQSDWLRKAFRAPGHPDYTAATRQSWLDSLVHAAVPYRFDLEFLTVWGAHLGWGTEREVGLLLAGVLDSGDETSGRTRETLVRILNGEHETAAPARYAVTALLASSNPEGWALVERLLLAAQRQEGLRQVVMESIDFAHRDAFVQILALIGRERLSRFAAVTRGVAVWFGIAADSAETAWVDRAVAMTLENLTQPEERARRIRMARGEELYLALWAEAFDDATACVRAAAPLLDDPDFERRYAAVRLLAAVRGPETAPLLRHVTADVDLRIALEAAGALRVEAEPEKTFDALRTLLPRIPRDETLPPALWPWNRIRARQAELALHWIRFRGARPIDELVPFLPLLDATGRHRLLLSLRSDADPARTLAPAERALALTLLGDASNTVREEAFRLLREAMLTPDEALPLEPLLARKAPDLRRGIIRLLLKQPPAACRASIERLEASGNAMMRRAAEEIRKELALNAASSVPDEDRQEHGGPRPTEAAAALPDTAGAPCAPPDARASRDDGLGLFDPAEKTPPVAPRRVLEGRITTPDSVRLLRSLDALVEQHAETPVTSDDGTTRELFGNLFYLSPNGALPLAEIWAAWWASEAAAGTAPPELTRALCTLVFSFTSGREEWARLAADDLVDRTTLHYGPLVRDLLSHLLPEHCDAGAAVLLLDAVETFLHGMFVHYDAALHPRERYEFWRGRLVEQILRVAESARRRHEDLWTPVLWRRYWGLLRWFDEGTPDEFRQPPDLVTAAAAHALGVASDADLYDHLLGSARSGPQLSRVTARKPWPDAQRYPKVAEFAERCRERVLEVELQRGDLPTAASLAALTLRSIWGAQRLMAVLRALGADPLSRGYGGGSEGKSVVLSHLVRVALPLAGDSPEEFAALARAAGVTQKRLVEVAVYAPQWATFVEQTTGIAGLREAAFWLHAHTKDEQWTVDQEIRELWFAEVNERTPLTRQELLDGAVDVAWFQRVRADLAPEAWPRLLAAAKFASSGGGHKRAELFASTLLGETSAEELTARMVAKRHLDSVRALGLAPLPADLVERQPALLARYETLQRFLRESRQFGAQRQASEKLAFATGLANLARTAGYPDPQRLSWAMEAEAVADLKAGPVEAVEGAVRVRLSIDAAGEPELHYEKAGKALKELPAALRKIPALAALRARKTELAQQAARMRISLEESMVRGDRFTAGEVEELSAHPLLRPMVAALLFAAADGQVTWPADLDSHPGPFRIAHPADLLASGQWPAWQRACLAAERIQPFKQAFRELYILTEAERATGTHSERYAGQQVHPRQAIALLGKRGWVNVPEEGLRRTFHEEDVSGWVTFLEGWFTPSDVDGLTVEHIRFARRSDGQTLRLDAVPPRLFSEAMRDLDLMVSVAHRGGVDPEATASTVEMRTMLLREMLALMKIANVRLEGAHALINGSLSRYNVHLGSGTVHRQPGGNLCILPVHSQHRGRLFLPFADNDPKTAEVVSKVLLLAQDKKIKDPTILEQLR